MWYIDLYLTFLQLLLGFNMFLTSDRNKHEQAHVNKFLLSYNFTYGLMLHLDVCGSKSTLGTQR